MQIRLHTSEYLFFIVKKLTFTMTLSYLLLRAVAFTV